ncbi:FAD-binding oxidoreductase [Oceanicoccus sp. KOV_DT_Chl]|uniref:NAD(P)/FAD-dependent oxidoreductase n=1 Tax=Oceanicoccus sp. KOV_DT_Chl TaxID=1904639 RepID=UPI000C7DB50A|nr:FAD-binding oxidoreductase [Oceanicoccus sp. KOV_DT_Chl]
MLNPSTHSSEYPDSYYAASLKYTQRYPRLEGQRSTQVCVIGGGFSGVNTALELAEKGYQVTLLEAYQIGWGASGRNGGQIIRGVGHGTEQFRQAIGQEGIDAIDEMGFEANEIIKARVKRYTIDCDLKMGYCDLATKPRHLKDFEDTKSWLDSRNYPYETRLLSKSEMSQVVGSDAYIGGMIDMGSGHLHPLNLICAEAAAAAEQGVQIYEQSAVTDIQQGDTCTIKTQHGEIKADRLVICGNAYVAGLNNTLEGQILPAGSYVIATEPLSEQLCQQLLPQDMAVCDQRVDLDYYRLSADKRLLFGGLCTYSGRDPNSIVNALRPNMDKVFPYLKDIKIEYQWGGMIGIGANRLPQIGRLRPNVYFAQAYAGHGVNVTHVAARLIAEHIDGDSQRMEVFEKVKHLRFPGGRRFRSPLLAIGMSYHRLKDIF